jgi:hypothetical protein
VHFKGPTAVIPRDVLPIDPDSLDMPIRSSFTAIVAIGQIHDIFQVPGVVEGVEDLSYKVARLLVKLTTDYLRSAAVSSSELLNDLEGVN